MLRRHLAIVLGVTLIGGCGEQGRKPASDAAPVTVFAAASLTDALIELGRTYETEAGHPVRLSFAASGAVARQIEAGAPADIVIVADAVWMDRLAASGRVSAQSRVDLLSNRLVLIAPRGAQVTENPWAGLGSEGRIAIGDPASVPAGAYAQTWLQQIGRWNALQSRLVTASDVRAVRTFVSRGEARLGIVYRSDTVGTDAVQVILEPPSTEQPDIVYPAALTERGGADAGAFLAYLQSPKAAAVFRRYGFEP